MYFQYLLSPDEQRECNSDTSIEDSEIQTLTVTACDALLGMALPKPAANVLQIWQSADFSDANGNLGYLRYGFEILNAITNEPDQSLCEQAMDMYLDYCQSCEYSVSSFTARD